MTEETVIGFSTVTGLWSNHITYYLQHDIYSHFELVFPFALEKNKKLK